MNKTKPYEQNVFLFLITFAFLFFIGINQMSRISGTSTFISMALGATLSYFFLNFYKSKGQNSSLLLLPPLFLSLHYMLTEITQFISLNIVDGVNSYLLSVSLLLLVMFTIKKGRASLLRASFIFFLTIVFLFLISFVFLFPNTDFQSILPLIDKPIADILKSAMIYFFISTIPLFYIKEITKVNLSKKDLKRGFILTHLFLLFLTLLIFGILGLPLANLYPYPELALFKKISFLNIIDRMESIFSLSYFLASFFTFAITFDILFSIIKEKFNIKKEEILLLFLSFLLLLSSDFSISPKLFLGINVGLVLLDLITCKTSAY